MKGKAVVATPWWIRLAIYAVVAVVGLVLTVLGFANPGQVDMWLTQSGSIAALIGGLLAATNTNKGSDTVEVDVPDDFYDVDKLKELQDSLSQARVEINRLNEVRGRAENLLGDVTNKVDRVNKGEPIFSVFHE